MSPETKKGLHTDLSPSSEGKNICSAILTPEYENEINRYLSKAFSAIKDQYFSYNNGKIIVELISAIQKDTQYKMERRIQIVDHLYHGLYDALKDPEVNVSPEDSTVLLKFFEKEQKLHDYASKSLTIIGEQDKRKYKLDKENDKLDKENDKLDKENDNGDQDHSPEYIQADELIKKKLGLTDKIFDIVLKIVKTLSPEISDPEKDDGSGGPLGFS